MGKLRKHKILVAAFIFGFILLSSCVVSSHAQPEDFPIGMYIVYTADSQIPPAGENIYTIRYDFRQWSDQESLLVEYEKNGATYIEPLFEIYLDGPEHPPIWLDVSLFQTQSVFTFSGYNYHYVGIEEHWVPGLEEECFRIEYSLIDNNMENWSILYYHCETGIMVDYIHAAFYEDYSLRESYMNEVFETNLDEFNSPTFTLPEPTQTTTTTTSTTTSIPPDQTTTTSTTRSTTTTVVPLVGLNEALGVGIIIEIAIIIVFMQIRRK